MWKPMPGRVHAMCLERQHWWQMSLVSSSLPYFSLVRSSLVYSREYQKAYCLDSQCASQRGPVHQDFILLQDCFKWPRRKHTVTYLLLSIPFFFFSSDSLSSPASAPHKWCVTFSSDWSIKKRNNENHIPVWVWMLFNFLIGCNSYRGHGPHIQEGPNLHLFCINILLLYHNWILPFLRKKFIFILCIWVFYLLIMCMCVPHICLVPTEPQRPKKGVGSTVLGIIDSCELSCGHQDLTPGPLQVYQVLLTMEPSFCPQTNFLLSCYTVKIFQLYLLF